MGRERISKQKDISSKDYTENWPKKILATCSVLKTISWAYKIKDLDRKTMIQSFYGRKLFIGLIINLSYNPERDSHIRDKVKVELDLSNYTTKKN